MSENLDSRYFIVLDKDKIIFFCLNSKNKILFKQNYDFINYNPVNSYLALENFLNENLIKIEKDLNVFIRKIFIIVDLENTLIADLSLRHYFQKEKNNQHTINDLLNLLKNQFAKYSNDLKIIHMVISKFLIDGKESDLSSINENFENLTLEVQFECLKDHTVIALKKILSKYQISLEKIISANFLKKFSQNRTSDIIYSANKIINGELKNEVISVKKKPKNTGFFENFFHLFG